MAPPDSRAKYGFMQDLALIAAANIGVFYLVKYVLSRLESEEDKSRKQKAQASAAHLQRLDKITDRQEKNAGVVDSSGRPRKEDLQLNQYEQAIALEVVAPEDIAVGFEDIGGLDTVIEELTESVIYPLTMPHLYSHQSSLLSAPPGVLLYGPPGCGKTMLAKALARESGATFINLHISTLTEKWFGDSNKLVSAVFSLATKLQPTIVFIDEIDAVLGQRRSGEHEASNMVKAEFMTHWDGLASANIYGEAQRIMVLGATNRIGDIDEAILRRMPKKFPVSLPNAQQRLRILGLLLKDTKVDRLNFDLKLLVDATAGLSGSDLKEACRDAAMVPVREFIREQKKAGKAMNTINSRDVRGLRTEDFFGAAGGNQILARMATKKVRPEKSKSTRSAASEKTAVSSAEEEEDIEEVSD